MSKTDLININDNNENHKIYKFLDTEEMFMRQKSEIEKTKNKNKKIKLKTTFDLSNNVENSNNSQRLNNNESTLNNIQHSLFNNALLPMSLMDYNQFECTEFYYDIKEENEEKLPKIDNTWNENKEQKFIELKNLALRTKSEINYDKKGLKLQIEFTLKNESQLWIFSRSYVNKFFNESYNFDAESLYNEPNDVFNKYSSVIKITKEMSNKCFINYGTFVEDKNRNTLIYKTFFKRQLIECKEIENNPNDDESIDNLSLILIDTGNENIETKVKINNSKKENISKGNFYIPINKKAKLLFGGVGESVEIKKLYINIFDKEDESENFNTIFSNEKKTCNCCILF